MSLTRCSRHALLSLMVVLAAVTGTAAAFESSADSVPDATAVGDEVTVTYTIDDPFTDVSDQWTLQASTELENVGWTVTTYRAGNQLSENVYGNESFEQDLSIDSNADEVQIELTGTTPEIENYTYSPREEYVLASLARTTGSNTEEFRNDSVHHYTEDSQAARTAIDDAQAAIDDAGGNEEAERLLERAISAYNNGNFQDNAIPLAEDAQAAAESAQQSQQTTQTALMGAGALLVLGLIAGGIYYWRSQQGDDYSRL